MVFPYWIFCLATFDRFAVLAHRYCDDTQEGCRRLLAWATWKICGSHSKRQNAAKHAKTSRRQTPNWPMATGCHVPSWNGTSQAALRFRSSVLYDTFDYVFQLQIVAVEPISTSVPWLWCSLTMFNIIRPLTFPCTASRLEKMGSCIANHCHGHSGSQGQLVGYAHFRERWLGKRMVSMLHFQDLTGKSMEIGPQIFGEYINVYRMHGCADDCGCIWSYNVLYLINILNCSCLGLTEFKTLQLAKNRNNNWLWQLLRAGFD